MMLRRSIYGIAGLAMSMYAPLAAAQVPSAMDRAPADAHIVGAIKNLERFSGQVRNLAEQLNLPEDAISQLQHVNQMLAMPGLNAGGSAAFVVMPGEAEDEQSMVMILPVTDMQAMVRELGGEPGAGVNSVEIDGKTLYLKNIDGGFVAAGEQEEAVEAFKAATGSSQKFQQMLGPSGASLIERSEVFFVANIPAMAPKLREGLQQGMEQAEMMAMMAGGGQAPNFAAIKEFADEYLRDAQSAVVGLNLGEAGMSLGFATQFTADSQMAKYFQAKGNAGQVLGALPNQPYLMAVAVDSSSPGVKAFFKRLASFQPEGGQGGVGPMQIAKMMDKVDGAGFFWGTTPAVMGGLFLNAITYYRTSDPGAVVQQTRETMEKLNKQTVNDITFTTAYTANAEKVGERQVDTWSMKMQADPTKPGGAQMAQMQMMLFGHAGPGGYLARTENGVLMTYSKNKTLLEQAITAANQGDQGFMQDQHAQSVAKHLPEGGTVAGFVGIRNILDLAVGFMAMMGGGPQIDIPENLPPIGFGVVTSSGGMHGQLFVPMSVMQTFREMGESMNQGMDEEMDFEDDAGQDEF